MCEDEPGNGGSVVDTPFDYSTSDEDSPSVVDRTKKLLHPRTELNPSKSMEIIAGDDEFYSSDDLEECETPTEKSDTDKSPHTITPEDVQDATPVTLEGKTLEDCIAMLHDETLNDDDHDSVFNEKLPKRSMSFLNLFFTVCLSIL